MTKPIIRLCKKEVVDRKSTGRLGDALNAVFDELRNEIEFKLPGWGSSWGIGTWQRFQEKQSNFLEAAKHLAIFSLRSFRPLIIGEGISIALNHQQFKINFLNFDYRNNQGDKFEIFFDSPDPVVKLHIHLSFIH